MSIFALGQLCQGRPVCSILQKGHLYNYQFHPCAFLMNIFKCIVLWIRFFDRKYREILKRKKSRQRFEYNAQIEPNPSTVKPKLKGNLAMYIFLPEIGIALSSIQKFCYKCLKYLSTLIQAAKQEKFLPLTASIFCGPPPSPGLSPRLLFKVLSREAAATQQ